MSKGAETFPTPVGRLPLSSGQQAHYGRMSNQELVDNLYSGHFVDPLVLNELSHRGLAFRGDFEADIRARIERAEERSS